MNHKKRILNKDKVNNTEFEMSDIFFNKFLVVFKNDLKQKTDWQPKYFPKNYFGDQIATFEFFDIDIVIQRNEDHSDYSFEIEESVLTLNENSLIQKIDNLLIHHEFEYDKIECFLI